MNGPDLHSRRAMLAAAASTGTVLLAGCLGDVSSEGSGETTETPERNTAADTAAYVDYGRYLNDAIGWEGPGSTVDERGQSEVTISVGAGDGFGFDPVAVRVDPGTTVTWEWTGNGGAHNVHVKRDDRTTRQTGSNTARDSNTSGRSNASGASNPATPSPESGLFSHGVEFESPVQTEGSFEWTAPDVDAIVPYVCEPHEGQGMKAALAIGDVPTTTTPTTATATPEHTAEPVTDESPEASDPWDDDFGGALAATENYDGTVADETDADTVTIEVGKGWGDENQYGFNPPAVRVTAGTRIEWVWTENGSAHNVHATRGAAFESPVRTSGTFEWVVPSDFGRPANTTGTSTEQLDVVVYQCEPHAGMGMRGVIVVE